MAADTAQTVDFTLPSVGSDMDEGTVLTWLVDVGDRVVKGDVLLRVDTEKAEIDVEVWHEAVVLELLVEPGDIVPVGTTIARLATGSQPQGSGPADRAVSAEPKLTAAPDVEGASEAVADATAAGAHDRPAPPAPPASTRQAAALGRRRDDAVHVTPRLVYWPSDIREASTPNTQQQKIGPTPSRAQRRQAAVASLMDRSNREIPHFYLARQLDLEASLSWLEQHNESVPPTERILPAALLLYGVARAAHGAVINGTFQDKPVDADHVDLGVAVHVRGGGLMTPVVPAAESLSLTALMDQLRGVVGRARGNRLNTSDMTPATLTVTNLGESGADQVLGLIRPPERALVGFGRIAERPIVRDGVVEVRRTVDVSLSADHRVVNGQAGARFIDALNNTLSKPEAITLVGGPHDR